MNVKIVVLSNGDKIIGKIIESENNNSIIMEDVLLLKEILTEEGFSIIPISLVQTSDKYMKINCSNIVVYPCEPKKEIFDLYIQILSNIIIPRNVGIMN